MASRVPPNEDGSGVDQPGRLKYSTRSIEKALKEGGGILSKAAEVWGCSADTISKRVRKSERLQKAMWEARERAGDIAEETFMVALRVENELTHKALAQVERGSTTPDMPRLTATIFAQKTLNKARGYSQTHEVTGAGGEPLVPGAGFVFMRDKPVVKNFEEWRSRHLPEEPAPESGGDDSGEKPTLQ
jgi:hypothetical protein